MGTLAYFWLIVAGLLFACLWLRERRRTTAIQAMAARLGFVYLGRALPKSLSLNGTPIEHTSSVWNAIDGECRGTRVVAFDCRIGYGKASWRRTVIAAQSPRDIFGKVRFDSDLTAVRSGKWSILYQPKTFSLIPPGLMPVPELEAHIDVVQLSE
jgi:hypothetical protein